MQPHICSWLPRPALLLTGVSWLRPQWDGRDPGLRSAPVPGTGSAEWLFTNHSCPPVPTQHAGQGPSGLPGAGIQAQPHPSRYPGCPPWGWSLGEFCSRCHKNQVLKSDGRRCGGQGRRRRHRSCRHVQSCTHKHECPLQECVWATCLLGELSLPLPALTTPAACTFPPHSHMLPSLALPDLALGLWPLVGATQAMAFGGLRQWGTLCPMAMGARTPSCLPRPRACPRPRPSLACCSHCPGW